MRHVQFLLIAPLAFAAAFPASADDKPSDRQMLEQRYETTHRQWESARSTAIAARMRLAELNLERRIAQQAIAQQAPTRNPQWDRLANELRALETKSQRLAEKLAPAHPDMQTLEAEIRGLRAQLENVTEFIDPPAPTVDPVLDSIHHLHSAEQDLEAAERALARAADDHRTATIALAATPPAIIIPAAKPVEPVTSIPTWMGFALAGLIIVVCLISRKPSAPKGAEKATVIKAEEPVTRIVYSAPVPVQQPVAAVNVNLARPWKTQRPTITPRRRTA